MTLTAVAIAGFTWILTCAFVVGFSRGAAIAARRSGGITRRSDSETSPEQAHHHVDAG